MPHHNKTTRHATTNSLSAEGDVVMGGEGTSNGSDSKRDTVKIGGNPVQGV